MTQEERSELRVVLRDRRLIKAMNEVLANLPMKDAADDLTKPFSDSMAANRYYFHAGALKAFNSLLGLGYSLTDAGKAHQRVTVPQFRPEKQL